MGLSNGRIAITLYQSTGSNYPIRASSGIGSTSCQERTKSLLICWKQWLGLVEQIPDVHFLAACLLGFAAFLRYEELSSLKCSDVLFFTYHMEIKIRSSKTDQLHQGDRVLVAHSTNITCLVAMQTLYGHGWFVKLLWDIVPSIC